jgi:hypothetical protein
LAQAAALEERSGALTVSRAIVCEMEKLQIIEQHDRKESRRKKKY